jgi:hypothetical protein
MSLYPQIGTPSGRNGKKLSSESGLAVAVDETTGMEAGLLRVAVQRTMVDTEGTEVILALLGGLGVMVIKAGLEVMAAGGAVRSGTT